MFPPGGAGFAGVPKIAPGGVYAANASSQTIGTTGADAAAQTAPGNPFTVEGDLRFPLESMRNTSMFDRENTGSYDVATGATQAGGHGSSSAGPALPSEEMLSHDEILAQREQQRVLMARRRALDPLMLAHPDPVPAMVTPERLRQYRTEDEVRAWDALGVEPPRRNPAYPPPPSAAEETDAATYGGSDPAVMYDLLDRITEPEPRARDVYVQHQAQLRQQTPVAVSGREHVGERSLPAQFPGVISTNQMPLSPDPMKKKRSICYPYSRRCRT